MPFHDLPILSSKVSVLLEKSHHFAVGFNCCSQTESALLPAKSLRMADMRDY